MFSFLHSKLKILKKVRYKDFFSELPRVVFLRFLGESAVMEDEEEEVVVVSSNSSSSGSERKRRVEERIASPCR